MVVGRRILALWFALAGVCVIADARGATIEVGSHSLLGNTPGQDIQIYVSGGESVAGLNLYAQVGDGGPELGDFGLPAGNDGPAITDVDLKTGTVFGAVTGPQDNQQGIPQVAISSIEFATPGTNTVADGLLATLTIDTTGFFGGTWDLLLSDVLPTHSAGPFHTDFAGIDATIINGSIVVEGGLPGDFDSNGVVDVSDIDLLHSTLRAGGNELIYDVDRDGGVTDDDLDFLVENILGSFYGDTNLDRAVDATDLNAIGLNWRGNNKTWGHGDFDGDTVVDARDLNLLGLNWRKDAAASATAAVPEPSCSGWLFVVLVLFGWAARSSVC